MTPKTLWTLGSVLLLIVVGMLAIGGLVAALTGDVGALIGMVAAAGMVLIGGIGGLALAAVVLNDGQGKS